MHLHLTKRNMRRFLALLLACALFAAVLPATGAFAGSVDFNTNTIKVYEWKQIRTQKDFPEKGTYPLLLCYTDQNGVHRFMKSTKIDEPSVNIYRDGRTDSNKDAWKKASNERSEKQYNALDAEARAGKTLEQFRAGLPYWNRDNSGVQRNENHTIGFDGVNCIDSTPVSDAPEIAVGCESFFTTQMPTTWRLNVTGKKEKKAGNTAVVRIYAGDKEFGDGLGYPNAMGFGGCEAELELEKIGEGDDYCVYTTDLGGGRAKYTDEGCVQIYYHDDTTGGINSGLSWDGKKVGTIEFNSDYYSNFTMYYAVEKTFSVIDRDYTVGKGSTMYANNNLMLLDGVNLTIAPGGILCVTGTFYNNGVIHNCGTVVINPGARIDSLHPADAASGQLNCYGGATAEVPVYSAPSPQEGGTEADNMTLDELDMKISLMEATLADSRQLLANSSAGSVSEQEIAYLKDSIAQMEAALEIYRQARASRAAPGGYAPTQPQLTGSTTYKNCQGDLVIMGKGALVLNTQSQCKLNLYEGASCVNNGLLVAPNGITLTDAELLNRSRGSVFSGYYFTCAKGGDVGSTVVDPGTGSASVPDLTRCTGSISAFAVNGRCHVSNQGGLLVNGSISGGTDCFDGNAIVY